jgi:hypothetical protein
VERQFTNSPICHIAEVIAPKRHRIGRKGNCLVVAGLFSSSHADRIYAADASAARKVSMRRLVEHGAAAIALAALLALLIPASVVPSNDNVIASAVTGATAISPAAAAAEGRWKLGGDGSCSWDPDDSGPDQCSPISGRWKLGGDGSCYWDANDSGPNQCEPPAESAAAEARASSPATAFHRGV